MKIRLLALDLDGTLTNVKKEIPPYTKHVLLKAQQQGIRIILASGRPTQGILHLAEELELSKHSGYILAFNGGLIIDCSTGKVIDQCLLPTTIYPYLYKKGNQGPFRILSYKDQYIVAEDTENEYVRYDAMLNSMPLLQTDNFLETINFPEPKCLIVGEPEKLEALEREMKSHLEGQVNVFRSEPFFLEIVPLGIDKAQRLAKLLELIGSNREELMACGDGFNDLSMIQYAGIGVAMGNAQEIVKQHADYITLSNEQDGVARAVEKFILSQC